MARKRRRRSVARRNAVLGGAAVAALLVAEAWARVWPYVVGVAGMGAVGVAAWWMWRTDRSARGADRRWRAEEALRLGRRSLAEVDALSWQDFERYVAELCRRDGCTDVTVTGRSGDLGADVTATLPDGRRLVVQCKHYAPHRTVPSGDVQKFIGTAWLHHRADAAAFVATCRFSNAALALAVRHRILAVHRDLLGQWNTGTPLLALYPLNGTAQGPRPTR
ncbi:restriction endonuclease [Actinacidiphila sp. bgisy145]|uniref:restriction endonuclease n=1 Tax=Actinacidiphila sp. bgisy145 TaxID=3413792 RepID=UPI003EB9DE2B